MDLEQKIYNLIVVEKVFIYLFDFCRNIQTISSRIIMDKDPYPRFIDKAVEDIFIHWLNIDRHHSNKNLLETIIDCEDCAHFKDILDFGVQ